VEQVSGRHAMLGAQRTVSSPLRSGRSWAKTHDVRWLIVLQENSRLNR